MRLFDCDHLPYCVTFSGCVLNGRSVCSQISLQKDSHSQSVDWTEQMYLRVQNQTLKYEGDLTTEPIKLQLTVLNDG